MTQSFVEMTREQLADLGALYGLWSDADSQWDAITVSHDVALEWVSEGLIVFDLETGDELT